jgi:chitin disaccharide deacetylase
MIEKNKYKIILHADDFGWNDNISSNIIDCVKSNKLNSLSIIVNSSNIENIFNNYKKLFFEKKTRLSLHLNLAEGKPTLLDKSSILINQNGEFKYTFIKFFFKYFLSSKKTKNVIKVDLTNEISAQIDKYTRLINDDNYPLNIDSHTHFHMIPIIFKILTNLIDNYKIKYIRIPEEKYFFSKSNIKMYFSLNIFKHLLLNFLSILNRLQLKKYPHCKQTKYFIGVLYSGKMTLSSIDKALEKIIKKRVNTNSKIIEILLHPGGEPQINKINWTNNNGFKNYYSSKNRFFEKKIIMQNNLIKLIKNYENIINS